MLLNSKGLFFGLVLASLSSISLWSAHAEDICGVIDFGEDKAPIYLEADGSLVHSELGALNVVIPIATDQLEEKQEKIIANVSVGGGDAESLIDEEAPPADDGEGSDDSEIQDVTLNFKVTGHIEKKNKRGKKVKVLQSYSVEKTGPYLASIIPLFGRKNHLVLINREDGSVQWANVKQSFARKKIKFQTNDNVLYAEYPCDDGGDDSEDPGDDQGDLPNDSEE